MLRYSQLFVLLSFLLLAVEPALAQKSPRRPGLWEVTTRTLLDGKARERSMSFDRLTKERKAEVLEQMRANGVRLMSDTAAGRVIQVCVSQEQARKEPEFFGPTLQAVGCKQQEIGRTDGGKTAMFEFACMGKFVGNGKGQTTLESPERYSGWTETKTSAPDGMIKPLNRSMLVRNEIKGRWLKADCGTLGQTKGAMSTGTPPKTQ
jgi:Protein of unknown function (DUF3617)